MVLDGDGVMDAVAFQLRNDMAATTLVEPPRIFIVDKEIEIRDVTLRTRLKFFQERL